MEEITIKSLNIIFGRKPGNCARTGYIPMTYFNCNEKAIRKLMKKEGMERVIYRGPRLSNNCWNTSPSMTRRCDANFAVLY